MIIIKIDKNNDTGFILEEDGIEYCYYSDKEEMRRIARAFIQILGGE